MILPPFIVVPAFLVLAQADAPTKAEDLAEIYGRTLGAAAACSNIARPRVDAAEAAASAHLKTLAANEGERAVAGRILADNVDRGGRDVADGLTTCAQAESELADLEHELAAPR